MTYSVSDLCEKYGVGEHTVLAWVKSGELKGVNVARKPGTRPKWRFTAEAIAQFEISRESGGGAATATKAKRKRQADPEVIQFYK
jgi:transposase